VSLKAAARVLGTIQDLSSTLKRRSELDILKKVIEWNSEILLISNEEGMIIYASEIAEDMIGGSNKMLLGKDIYKLLKFPKPNQFSTSNSNQNVWDIECRTKAAGAEALTYQLSIRFMYEKGNELSGCVVLGHKLDATSREKGNRLLSSDVLKAPSDGRRELPNGLTTDFTAFLEHISSGLFIQTKGGIVYGNGAFCSLMKYSVKQMNGRSFANFLVGDAGEAVGAFIKRSIKSGATSGDVLKRECSLLCADGTIMHILLNVRAIMIAGKRAVIGDITNMSALGHSTNNDYTMASDKLAYKVIQEINQPLQSMFEALTKIRNTSLECEDEKAYTDLEQGLKHINKTVNSMISVYKPELNKKIYLSFNDIIRQSVDIARNSLQKKGIVVKLSLSSYVQKTMASPHQMLHLSNIMIMRAANAMPSGGALTISTRKRGSSVVLEFQDTSAGMSGEERRRIFDPLLSKDKRHNGNSAQDLSWVHAIVTHHSGKVRVRSILGKGARFSIILPIVA
jgi:PAS domain S-box-containing protein